MQNKLENELLRSAERMYALEKVLQEELLYLNEFSSTGIKSNRDLAKGPVLQHINKLRKEIEEEEKEQRSIRLRMLAAREFLN